MEQIGAKKIGIVYLRDAVGRNNRCPPGAGEINFRELFEALSEGGHCGFVSSEFTDAAPTLEGNIEILRQSIRYLERLN